MTEPSAFDATAAGHAAQLTHVEADFAQRRVRAAANFAAVLGFAMTAAEDAGLDAVAAHALARRLSTPTARASQPRSASSCAVTPPAGSTSA